MILGKSAWGFIVRHEPQVEQTQHAKQERKEPIYSRIRNDYTHARGKSFEETEADMAKQLGGLVALVKKAIDLHNDGAFT